MEGTGEGCGFFCSPQSPYLGTMSQQLSPIEGARGLIVTTLLRKGACLSKIEERTDSESYWSQSSDRFNEGELYSEEERISVHKLSESMLHSLRVTTVSFALGGFLTARLQWTAKRSERTGSWTDKFETDVSPDLVIIRSRTLLFLCVGVQRLKISRLKQIKRSRNWLVVLSDGSLTWKLKSPFKSKFPHMRSLSRLR